MAMIWIRENFIFVISNSKRQYIKKAILIHSYPIVRYPLPESLLWRHNGRDGVSKHQPYDYLLSRSFRRRLTKTSKLRITGLQKASNTEDLSLDAVIMVGPNIAEGKPIDFDHINSWHVCALV